MHILLPASTDIFLTGGKSHDSEIRLAKLIIRQLGVAGTFIDIGTHYGYFSLLAHQVVGPQGKVYSFEASPGNYAILKLNAKECPGMETYHSVVSNEKGECTFYEFPNLYSEYNTLDISQFKNESWLKHHPPKMHKLPCLRLGDFFFENNVKPDFIKIDVEGAEFLVVKGMEAFLRKENPMLVLEFLSAARGNENHLQALHWLSGLGYHPFAIHSNGDLTPIKDVVQYLQVNQIDSDNIVFRKEQTNH
ncbi:MAG: FkbM family methyltransferase [Saprospiraceae bacterium]|nr:FkbM family methyltransferase [Saprospiraceae bacterium]